MIMKFKEFARVGFVSSQLELNNLVVLYMNPKMWFTKVKIDVNEDMPVY